MRARHVLCRFGEELINASRVDESTLRALRNRARRRAPATSARPLALTLNGQQFTEAAADGAFVQYEPPQISTLYPVSGPATGGETTITVRGNGLGFGRADDSGETRRARLRRHRHRRGDTYRDGRRRGAAV